MLPSKQSKKEIDFYGNNNEEIMNDIIYEGSNVDEMSINIRNPIAQ